MIPTLQILHRQNIEKGFHARIASMNWAPKERWDLRSAVGRFGLRGTEEIRTSGRNPAKPGDVREAGRRGPRCEPIVVNADENRYHLTIR